MSLSPGPDLLLALNQGPFSASSQLRWGVEDFGLVTLAGVPPHSKELVWAFTSPGGVSQAG